MRAKEVRQGRRAVGVGWGLFVSGSVGGESEEGVGSGFGKESVREGVVLSSG